MSNEYIKGQQMVGVTADVNSFDRLCVLGDINILIHYSLQGKNAFFGHQGPDVEE